MDCFCLRLDVAGGSLNGLGLDDRARFYTCCEDLLRLSLSRFDSKNTLIKFSDRGGFCLVRQSEPQSEVGALLQTALVFPTFINFLARPPILANDLLGPISFNRSIHLMRQLPDITDVQALSENESFRKHLEERLTGEKLGSFVDKVFFGIGVYELIKDTITWPVRSTDEAQEPFSLEPFGISPRSFVQPGIDAHLGVLAHLRALENATIYALQAALKQRQSSEDVLRNVFEPGKYVWETLVAIKALIESSYPSAEGIRVALFVPDAERKVLILVASAADISHTAREIPIAGNEAGARVFKSGKPCVKADTSDGDFPFFYPNQGQIICSHFSMPILERKLVIPDDQILPVPDDSPWGPTRGVLCLDSCTRGAFGMLAGDNGEAFAKLLDPLVADLYIGLLLRTLKERMVFDAAPSNKTTAYINHTDNVVEEMSRTAADSWKSQTVLGRGELDRATSECATLIKEKNGGRAGKARPLRVKGRKRVVSDSISARNDLAEDGGAVPPDEGSMGMATPKHSAAQDAVFDSNILSMLSLGDVTHVRFPNEEEEIRSLGLLLKGGHTVHCYQDDVYGLTSESQVRTLTETGIRFTVVE